jgi:nicotinamide mononucleotide transporter
LDHLARLLTALQGVDLWEATGLVTGVLCVWLLIRQNVWNFPIGLVFSVVSMVVLFRSRLYAELPENAYYAVMNAYGWWYWLARRDPVTRAELPVTHVEPRTALLLAAIFVAATGTMGTLLATRTDAALPYIDSATAVASFIAMWLTARKHIENWYLWFVVDIARTAIYLARDVELYALLYAIYLVMAVMGWWAWRRTMLQRRA